jgi:DNA repair protein RadC
VARLADLPEGERPRERLLRLGARALADRELIALVLRSGRQGESALAVAEGLLANYGSVTALARARPEELARYPGVGTAKAASLAAAFRLGAVAANPPVVGPVVRSAGDAAAAAMREIGGERRECVAVLVCDSRNRLSRIERVGEGALDRAPLAVREILNCVLRHDGRAFAVAHNHPSGDPEPGSDDMAATESLRAAARAVGLRFLGHVVVTQDAWASVSP